MIMCGNFDEATNGYKIYINNTEIAFVVQIKYLGVLIDNKLMFHKHINYLFKKIKTNVSICIDLLAAYFTTLHFFV